MPITERAIINGQKLSKKEFFRVVKAQAREPHRVVTGVWRDEDMGAVATVAGHPHYMDKREQRAFIKGLRHSNEIRIGESTSDWEVTIYLEPNVPQRHSEVPRRGTK